MLKALNRVTIFFIFLCHSYFSVAQSAPYDLRQKEILYLLKHDCGSCHGMTLKGGLGPALTPQALKNKPMNYLVATIMHGRAGTPMPPWQPFLSKNEVYWLVNKLKQGILQ
jgi:cytochrome c55X